MTRLTADEYVNMPFGWTADRGGDITSTVQGTRGIYKTAIDGSAAQVSVLPHRWMCGPSPSQTAHRYLRTRPRIAQGTPYQLYRVAVGGGPFSRCSRSKNFDDLNVRQGCQYCALTARLTGDRREL